MHQWKKIVTLLAAGLMIASCGKKDPLADQADHVKNAKPGVSKVERVLGEKDWVINADNGASYFAFAEGVESQATIQAAVLIGGYTYDVYVENQDDFKDASFVQNGKDWVFTWKPPQNIVPSSAPLMMPMRVVIAAKDATQKVVLSKSKEFPVYITANRGAPVFVKDENFPTTNVREGENRTFYVYIRDTDPVGSSPVAPQLRFEPAISSSTFGAVDVAAYLEVGQTTNEPTDPSLWKYKVTLNLTDKNLTRTTSQAVFRLRAVSRSNIQSMPRDYSFTVITGVARPEVDFYSGDTVTVKRGTKLTKVINFIDPNAKGLMKATAETATLPTGMTADCKTNPSINYFASCVLTWDVPVTMTPAQYRVKLKGENSSQAPGDNRKMEQPIEVRVEVIL